MLAAEYMGHIVGGWEYVYSAWGLTYAGVVFYAVSLYLRRAKSQKENSNHG